MKKAVNGIISNNGEIVIIDILDILRYILKFNNVRWYMRENMLKYGWDWSSLYDY